METPNTFPAIQTSQESSKFKLFLQSNKKRLTILSLIFFCTGVAVFSLSSELKVDTGSKNVSSQPLNPPAQQKNEATGNLFKENSKVVAINSEKNIYENRLLGFSFESPKDFGVVTENGIGSPSSYSIFVEVEEPNILDGKLLAEFRNDQSQLEEGDFGIETYPGKYYQKEVMSLGPTNLKIFTNIEDLECRGAELEKVIQFYRFERRITLVITSPMEKIMKENPSYFTTGESGCKDYLVWGPLGVESLFSAIIKRTAPKYILRWSDESLNIIKSIKIFDPTDPELFSGKVAMRPQGENMVLTLIANSKLGDVVTEMKLWFEGSEGGSWEPYRPFKTVKTTNKVNVRYKDKYGNISKVFTTSVSAN